LLDRSRAHAVPMLDACAGPSVPGMRSRLRRRSKGGPYDGNAAGNEVAPLLSLDAAAADQDNADNFLVQLQERDPFPEHRWRCLFNTVRAEQTLTHWAKLDVSIISAVDLIDPADTYFVDSSANSSVMVFSDDVFVYQTLAECGQNPQWNHAGFLNIIAPGSMVRIHVRHIRGNSDIGIGFVEFCAGDLPFDQDIEGWFELRFEERLHLTSKVRYEQHCRRRDDVGANSSAGDELETKVLTRVTPRELQSGPASERSSPVSYLAKKARKHSALCGVQMCRPPALEKDSGDKQYRRNAGEIFIRLRLTNVGDRLDGVFALALITPKPQHYGAFRPPGEAVLEDAQGIWDEAMDVKIAVFDDVIISVANYIIFILQWRRKLLSALVLFLFFLSVSNEFLQGPILLLVVTIIMVVNSNELLRLEMTCSGENAPLTEAGFKLVAKIGNVSTMMKFLRRTIEVRLSATIFQESGQLKLLSERCFRDGKPRISYEELKKMLRGASWIKKRKALTVGSLVMVKERYPATVKALYTDFIEVRYDRNKHSLINRHGRERDVSDTVDWEDVVARPDLAWTGRAASLVPDAIQEQVGTFRYKLDRFKHDGIPALMYISDIVTWKEKKIRLARIITATCAFGSVLLFVFHEWYRMCGTSTISPSRLQLWLRDKLQIRCGEKPGRAQWDSYELGDYVLHELVAFVVDHGLSTLFLLFGSTILLWQAGWLVPIRAVLRILVRLVTWKRDAPKMWAFFRTSVVDDEAV